MKTLAAVSLLLAGADAHGTLLSPRSRNSVDFLVGVNDAEWPCANITGDKCQNGQAAFWYSQGCFIGCPYCDHASGRRQVDLCGLGKVATLNDPDFRSVNRNATPGSAEDVYKHNPWRAPGSAPVANACGLAGGDPWGPNGAEEGKYTNTTFAHHGMKGTDLPPMPTNTKWKIGGEAEVAWGIRNNHGGGYQYRLCPSFEPLTEECFQRHPLPFVQDKQSIVFANGTRQAMQGTFVSEGTLPQGSAWARIPFPPTWLGPRCLKGTDPAPDPSLECEDWEGSNVDGPCKPCPGTPGSDCSRCDNGDAPSFEPPCGDGQCRESTQQAILDVVKIPDTLVAGDYVLGWRYDCEATAQVWSNCADITLTA